MYRISKRFHFSASHILEGLPEGHPCGRLHGHNYMVEITLADDALDAHGFVVDYGELAAFKKYLDDTFDHRHLNDVLEFQPSAENLAHHLFVWSRGRWPQVVEIAVSETPKTWARYSDG